MRRLLWLSVLVASTALAGTRRSQHWTDVPTGPKGKRTRTISNYINYQDQAGTWRASDPAIEDGDDGQGGGYEQRSVRAPLQAFIGKAATPLQSARYMVRLSDKPGYWVQIAASDGADVAKVLDRPGRKSSWPNLWTNTTLSYTIGRARVIKELVLSAAGHPASYTFTMRHPGNHSHVVGADGSISFKDVQGVEWLKSPPPWGEDANGNPIRVTLVEGAPLLGPVFQVVLTPNADDLAGAAYPVTVDPSVVISGTSAIEDNYLYISSNSNYGGSSQWRFIEDVGILRIKSTAFPAGTIDAFRWKPYVEYYTSTGRNVAFHRILPANADWVEGTASAVAQTGSSCANWKAYHVSTPTAWAGSAALGTSGVDYEAAAGVTKNFNTGVGWYTITLPLAWAALWQSTPSSNGGFRAKSVSGSGFVRITSTEGGANSQYFEIDYTEPPASTSTTIRSNLGRLIR